jgi:hypothetical protein
MENTTEKGKWKLIGAALIGASLVAGYFVYPYTVPLIIMAVIGLGMVWKAA